jgi:enoyl-CoA hydratase
VPAEALMDEALKTAEKIAAGPRDAVSLTKRALNLWVTQAAPAFDASLAFEMLNFMGKDPREGVAALREKRPPAFD